MENFGERLAALRKQGGMSQEDLAEKLLWALDHPDQMKEMAKKGQQIVTELLDLDNTANAVYEAYQKILN